MQLEWVYSDWLCRKLATSAHYASQHLLTRSVILRGLPFHGWVAVVPNCFHFVIIPLTVDCGIFRREEISWLELLHRWHPITVQCWNSLSSWMRPILSQMFVETVCMPWCLLLYTCGHGSDWNWFQLFGWVSEYFWQYSVSPGIFICMHPELIENGSRELCWMGCQHNLWSLFTYKLG